MRGRQMNEHAKKEGKEQLIFKRTGLVACIVSLFLGILGVGGYLPGMRLMASISADYIPMAPSTALSFILLSVIIIVYNYRPARGFVWWGSMIVTGSISMFGFLKCVEYFAGVETSFEQLIVPIADKLGDIPVGIMSYTTGGGFFLAGIGVMLFIYAKTSKKEIKLVAFLIGITGSLLILIGFVTIGGYVSSMPLLYEKGTVVPMALTTAIAILFLGIGMVAENAGKIRMTVGKKLGVGFGCVLIVLIFSGITTITILRDINSNMRRIIEVEDLMSDAAHEMNINFNEIGFSLMEHLNKHDPELLNRIKENAKVFEENHEEYLRLAREDEAVAAVIIGRQYVKFKDLVSKLVELEDEQDKKVIKLSMNHALMDDILDEKIQGSVKPGNPEAYKKVKTALELEINLNEITSGLGLYLRDYEVRYKQGVLKGEDDFRQFLEMYKGLSLSLEEKKWAQEIGILFGESSQLSKEIIDLNEKRVKALNALSSLRGEMDVGMEGEVQKLRRGYLAEADSNAEKMTRTAIMVSVGMLIIGSGIGTIAAVWIFFNLTGSVRALSKATAMVSTGDLDARVKVKSNDELGDLAKNFNQMTVALKRTIASRDDLEREIQGREKAEKEVRALALFPSENPSPVLRIAKDGKVLYSNDAAKDVLTAWGAVVNKTAPEKWQKVVAEALKTGIGILKEEKQGDRIVSIRVEPIVEAGYVNLYGRDVTQRRQNEDNFINLVDNLGSGVVVHAEDTSILLANKEAVKMLGLTEDEMNGKLVTDLAWDFLNEDGSKMGVEEFPAARVLTTKKPLKNFLMGWRSALNGRLYWVIVDGYPVFNAEGRITQAVITFVDITERNEAEKKLEEHKIHLESLVEERTAELAEKIKELDKNADVLKKGRKAMIYMVGDLKESEDNLKTEIEGRKRSEEKVRRYASRVQAANSELEAFSYSVSHDLRAPLRSMDGFSKAVLEDYGSKLDEEGRDYLTRIRKGSQRMAQLIDDILQLSRVGRYEIKMEEVDLSVKVAAILKELGDFEPEREIECVVKPGLKVKADENLLTIALNNLLGNAWKFTRKTKMAKIEFAAIRDNEETIYMLRDNGAGFDMKYKDKLFKAFQRLHPDKDYSGTGIGLVIVKRVVSKHGGKVWLESEPDKGTTVYFTLHD